MLPYASYLRIYEPAEAEADVPLVSRSGTDGSERLAVTVAEEQHLAMVGAIQGGAAPETEGHPSLGAYTLVRDGREYRCPVDLPLRTWLSMREAGQTFGESVVRLLVPTESRRRAESALTRWRRGNPTAVPHIRQATWGVPRTWFLLVVEEERERYDAGGAAGVRYRARFADARRRLGRAESMLSPIIEDLDLQDELLGLRTWLDSFPGEGWVELDYAGVAQLLGAGLEDDASARDVRTALRALRRNDFSAASSAYRRFEERWRAVSALERAS